MNVERILFEYQDAKRRYDILEDKREIVRSELMPKSPIISDMPKGKNGNDRMANYMAKLEALEDEIDIARNLMCDKMKYVSDLIAKIDDTATYQVLYYRYIKGCKWETIADALNYSRTNIFNLRAKGLDAVEKLIDDCK